MNVLVIGATGQTGGLAIKKLLAQGHTVTAYARNPAAITEKHERLKVARGDARDQDALHEALKGQDAVLSALGPRGLKRDDLQEAFMRGLIGAMKSSGVKRLVNLSAWGAGDSHKDAMLVFKIAKATVLRHVFADKDRGEALLFASDVDYVNVRPGRLLNAPARGGVKASLEPKGIKAELTRDDLADFMIAQLASPTWARKSPLIGY